MAVTNLVPHTPPADMLSLKDACGLLKDTNHPITVRTLRRRLALRKKYTERRGTADYASWADILQVHAEMVDERARP